MKTAMQQLIEYLDPIHSAIKDKAIELLKVEEEQIIDAWRQGDNDSMYSPKELDKQAKEYYNDTYEKM